MPYERELAFLKDTYAKCRLPLVVVDCNDAAQIPFDMGLYKLLGYDAGEKTLADAIVKAQPRTIYRMTDAFCCTYLFFQLPDEGHAVRRVVVIGPYLSVEITHEQLLEQCEEYGLNRIQYSHAEKYYSDLPVVAGDGALFAMLDTFADFIWGKDDYTLVDINSDPPVLSSVIPVSMENEEHGEAIEWQATIMERRYAYENEMMQAVAMGQMQKVELILSGFSKLTFERRLADPVRNLKNYCIITNTLLRKAAEQGGVHPIYLDRLSSDFARRIEALMSTDAVQRLMEEIFRGYCRLVRKNATSHYTPPIERTILYIDLHLGGDLSLKRLAEEQVINASYLSSLFKKETGRTLTDFINERRVQAAAKLLRSTKLQVQTVAQHCGISDVNYFSKIFKKYTGKTPGEYRKE